MQPDGQLLIENHSERIENLEQVTSIHDLAIKNIEEQQKVMLSNFQEMNKEVIRGNIAAEKDNKFLQTMLEKNNEKTFSIQETLISQTHEQKTKDREHKTKQEDNLWAFITKIVASGGLVYLVIDKLMN